MTKWDEWERAHAEQDARDRNILIGIVMVIVVLVLVSGMTGS